MAPGVADPLAVCLFCGHDADRLGQNFDGYTARYHCRRCGFQFEKVNPGVEPCLNCGTLMRERCGVCGFHPEDA